MSMADLITALRKLAHDGPTDHVVYSEKLGVRPDGMTVDGSNKVFRLGGQDGHSLPLVAASVYLTYGSTQRTQTGFAQSDNVNGIITFTNAPTNGLEILADYNYYWFSDAQYTEFLNEAAQTISAGVTDATAIIAGLQQALYQYALSFFFQSRASQYAERYASSGGEAGQSVQTVCQQYMALSKQAAARGATYRDDYYKRQGQREAPASTTVTYRVDPITPFR